MKSFSQYINEVSSEQLKKISSSSRIFDNIFGNKSRIVIPLRKDRSDYSFINHLSAVGYNVDLETGLAKSKVKTDQGVKERVERIGTVLSKLNKKNPSSGWDGMLKWWSKNKDRKVEDSDSGISIILSRNPIDIIRMSDHREFDSCHSPPGSKNTRRWKDGPFFKCAVQDAKIGGIIAYAVRTSIFI